MQFAYVYTVCMFVKVGGQKIRVMHSCAYRLHLNAASRKRENFYAVL